MITGRPIRFLATVVGSWTLIRLTMVLPLTGLPIGPPAPMEARNDRPIEDLPTTRLLVAELSRRVKILSPAQHQTAVRQLAIAFDAPTHGSAAALSLMTLSGRPPRKGWSDAIADSMLSAQMSFAQTPRARPTLAAFVPGQGLSPSEAGLPSPPQSSAPISSDRWSGAAWMLWRRSDDSADLARGGRLGGSQAGVRVDYAIRPASALRPIAYGRLVSALESPAAAEAAVGIAIRPRLPLPLTLAVERRQALSSGGRSDFALLLSGGFYDFKIGSFRLDGYGQGGMVGHDAFVDGRVTIEQPVTNTPDVAIGASIWGGAQPGLSRLDVGPQASLRLHVAGTTVRLGAEWRERIAGEAAPGSGPAMSLGSNF